SAPFGYRGGESRPHAFEGVGRGASAHNFGTRGNAGSHRGGGGGGGYRGGGGHRGGGGGGHHGRGYATFRPCSTISPHNSDSPVVRGALGCLDRFLQTDDVCLR